MPLNPNYSGVQQNIQITEVNGLQSAINEVQTNIQNETTDRLNSDVNLSNSLQALEITVNTKQAIINDNDLSISKVSGLQTALNTKQTTIGDGDLSISKVSGLQTALDTKQTTIGDSDLSISKVDGLQTALDTKQAIINDNDLSISKVDGLQTALDTLSGGGGGGSGIIKERFSRYTLGQTVSTSRGDITLQNVTSELTNTGSNLSWIELTGSNINYTPPANSSVVEYELSFYVYSSGTQNSGIGLQFYIDNVAQTITRAKQPLLEGGSSTWGQMRYSFKTTIEINGTTNANKCFVDNWNTSKNLKLRVSKLNSNTMSFHRVALLFTDNPVQNTDTIVAPLLTITAY